MHSSPPTFSICTLVFHSHSSLHVARMLPDIPVSRIASKSFLQIFSLIILLLSVNPDARVLPTHQVFPPLMSSLLFFHPLVPSKHPNLSSSFPGRVEKQRPSHLVNTLPPLLYPAPNPAKWISFEQGNLKTFQPTYLHPGQKLLWDSSIAARRGQKRPASCAARLKSSALFPTYGNAIFQVAFFAFLPDPCVPGVRSMGLDVCH